MATLQARERHRRRRRRRAGPHRPCGRQRARPAAACGRPRPRARSAKPRPPSCSPSRPLRSSPETCHELRRGRASSSCSPRSIACATARASIPDALRALIDVIAEQVAILEEDLAQAYDDQFIETCAEWVAPYIGDLIGYRSLHAVAPRIGSPRAEVANTIAYRRRKGTASMLEQLARDVSGWDARAVEYFQQLATTQYMNHLARRSIVWFDVRHAAGATGGRHALRCRGPSLRGAAHRPAARALQHPERRHLALADRRPSARKDRRR